MLPAPSELSIRNMLKRYTPKYGIILEVPLDEMVVGRPMHPRRFLWNRPVIEIGRTEFCFQFGPTEVGPVELIAELTEVCCLPTPMLAATEK